MTPIEWIGCSDTGLSSKTIWGVMMGASDWVSPSLPYDAGDFGRCYRLIERFPEWRTRLHEVKDKYPEWTYIVDNWDHLCSLYANGDRVTVCALLRRHRCPR